MPLGAGVLSDPLACNFVCGKGGKAAAAKGGKAEKGAKGGKGGAGAAAAVSGDDDETTHVDVPPIQVLLSRVVC